MLNEQLSRTKKESYQQLSPDVFRKYNSVASALNEKLEFGLTLFDETTNLNMVTHSSATELDSQIGLAIDKLKSQTIVRWHQTYWGSALITLIVVVIGGILMEVFKKI